MGEQGGGWREGVRWGTPWGLRDGGEARRPTGVISKTGEDGVLSGTAEKRVKRAVGVVSTRGPIESIAWVSEDGVSSRTTENSRNEQWL